MMILVTGGAGYIGSHTVKALLLEGRDVVVFDSLELGHRDAVLGGELVEGNLLDKDAVDAVFNKYSIDAVVHFAAYASVGDSMVSPDKYFTNNIEGGLNLVNAMREHGVGRIIFSSSAATYGEPMGVPIDESHPQNPTNPYGETKLMFEKILKWYDVAYGIKSVSLRYFNAAGADPEGKIGEDHTPEGHLIPIILQTLLVQRENVKVFGCDWDTPDGTCVRDYIHVTDLADAHLRALAALERGAETGAYNLGNGDGQSVKQMIDAAEEVTGKKVPWMAAPRRPGDPAKLVASSKKLKNELGWQPKYPDVRTIIEHAWRWHSTHPQGYAG
ncbi:MAG TPA: UDP-glucose 4-epimerase GalE [Armatimonadetes bacterium]|nr:UDP-glucose 4-epimerase GalE [Armatimonadota bacterium]